MSDDASSIQRFVAALVRRERVLLLVRVAARAGLLGVLVLALSVIAPMAGASRGPAALVVVVVAGVGGWLAVLLPMLVAWRRSGDRLRQARAVEELRPALRGRLITAVEHGEGGGSVSPELYHLVVSRAARTVGEVAPEEVHEARPAVGWVVAATVAWVVGVPAMLVGLGGPSGALEYWASRTSARAELAGVEVAGPADVAHVGDLLLRYTYPDYTGLEPRAVPNSTGDAHGPPGTVVEVTARAAEVVSAAGLVAYGDALEATVAEDGRSVTGRFTIRAEPGVYSVVLYRNAEAEPSREFQISPVDDLPPEVVLETESSVIEVAADQAFAIGWHVRDDYGIRSVGLAVDGADVAPPLRNPDRRVAELHEVEEVITPLELGLSEGQRVQLSVVAYDNDTVSGSKRGMSRQVELVVLGPRGLEQRADVVRERLMSAMIPVLARFLTEDWPVGTRSGQLSRWGETVSERYAPLVELVDEAFGAEGSSSPDGAVARRAVDAGRDLIRYTQVSFMPSSLEAANEEALGMTGDLRDDAIASLEDSILFFHQMRRNQALRDLVQQSNELDAMAEQLRDLLSNEDAEAQELLARLDQLERMMQRLAEQAQKLDNDGMGLREYLNTRESEARNLMEEIRKAIAQGDLEEARELMERLSNLVGEMGSGIKQELQKRMSQAGEQQDAGAELADELRKLEEEQRALQSEVQALREQQAGDQGDLATLWKKLEAEAAAHEKSAGEYTAGLVKHDRRFYEQERAAAANEEAEDLRAAIGVRDPSGARRSLEEGRGAWVRVGRAMEIERSGGRKLPGPGDRDLDELFEQLRRIEALLDELDSSQGQLSPQSRRQAEELQDRQRDLDNRLKQAQQDAREFARQSPVRPDGMEASLEEASERMGQASDDLGEGELMQAEGSQGVAAQRIREAIEAVEQAQQQAQQQAMQLSQPQAGQRQAGAEPSRGPDGDDNRNKVRIPGREEFIAPEEYRRGLIEGQQGEVPDEYRAMKRRYYEELVTQ